MKHVLVIQEANHIIGVASTVDKSFEMIKHYFGETSEIINVMYIEDSGLEYVCEVFVREKNGDGDFYPVTVHYFIIDDTY